MDPKKKTILVNSIASEWKIFARGTGVNPASINSIDLNIQGDQLKIEEFLGELVKQNSSNFMTVIKNSLFMMGREDVWKEIQISSQ